MNRAERISGWRERHRVKIGFIIGILFIWRAQPRNIVFLIIGIAAGFVGILIRQWAAGCLRKNDELATSGPYAIVRNPLYLGSFLAAAGLVFASSSFKLAVSKPYLDRTLFFWCLLIVMIDSIYIPKIIIEEQLLRTKFQSTFDAYAASVHRLIPNSFSLKRLDFSTFNWEQWKKNREYSSLIGYLFIAAILAARYHFQ